MNNQLLRRISLHLLIVFLANGYFPAKADPGDEGDSLKTALDSAVPEQKIDILLQLSKLYERYISGFI